MHIALISDVHALQTALTRTDQLGCDRILCAGDLVDWGLLHDEALQLVRERRIACIRRNMVDGPAATSGAALRVSLMMRMALTCRDPRALHRLGHHLLPDDDVIGDHGPDGLSGLRGPPESDHEI